MPEPSMRPAHSGREVNLAAEVLAGLTVSFVAISLGAAFGVLSGRGALAGILSAGVIALITSLLGGTRIQCSGPTAPMTTVTAAVVLAASTTLFASSPHVDPDRFVNLVLVLTGVILAAAAVFRLGRFIRWVPNVVISGFMNGIAILIWLDQVYRLFGLNGKAAYGGGLVSNAVVAVATLVFLFVWPVAVKRVAPRLSTLLPSTLMAIILMTGAVSVAGLGIERVELGGSLASFADLTAMVERNIPTQWEPALIWSALPFSLELAMLAYLDTLLTSLVIDKKVLEMHGVDDPTPQSKELAAQGLANGAVALFGGIPGAQATIRSVLILNEGAKSRLAGVLVGIFVVVEMLILQDAITLIPQAVFAGVLFKVGYDVFDWAPVKIYLQELRSGAVATGTSATKGPLVTHGEMAFVVATSAVTVLINLNVAVITFCALFYVVRRFYPVRDLALATESDVFLAED